MRVGRIPSKVLISYGCTEGLEGSVDKLSEHFIGSPIINMEHLIRDLLFSLPSSAFSLSLLNLCFKTNITLDFSVHFISVNCMHTIVELISQSCKTESLHPLDSHFPLG